MSPRPTRRRRIVPEPPPLDEKLGDKTPEYVRWYREHHTEAEFQARYAGRIISENQTIPVHTTLP